MATGSPLNDVVQVLSLASEVESFVQEMLRAANGRIATLSERVETLTAGEGPFEATSDQITILKQTVEALEGRRTKIEEILNG